MKAGELVERMLRFLVGRKTAYQLTLGQKNSPAAQFVLEDLAHFCRANETTFHDDPRRHAVLEGRREVWLRIQQHLQLSPDQLFELYQRKHMLQPTEENK